MDGLGPPPAVLEAFGLRGEPVGLVGGEGLAFRVGGVVLKRVHDVAEAEWTQSMLAAIDEDGFRVAAPIRAAGGLWVHDRWAASRFIAGLRPAAPRWHEIVACGLRFGAAAERARSRHTEALAARTHRWAVADRVAWDEADVDLPPPASEVRAALADLASPDPVGERSFVHGDLSGNVFVDQAGQFVVLDVSPYLRPRRWAAAIVVADAVLWHGAEPTLATDFAREPDDRSLLARALVFRLVAEQLADDPRHEGALAPYRRMLVHLSRGTASH